HFPTKIALAAAVFDDDIDEMERLASSPDATFDGLLDLVVARAAVSAALIDAITAERDQLVVQHLGIRMSELVSRVIARDIEAGRMSPDVDARDALTAVSMLARIVADALPDERPDTAVRARRVVTHGLRPRAVGSRG
ncbi:TetR/AcrR family transcriptional regulator, partial [Microbacterium sp.]